MKMSKYDTNSDKIIFMSTIIYILRHFWFFLSSYIKRNKYERPNWHPRIYFLLKSADYFYKLETQTYLYIISIKKLANYLSSYYSAPVRKVSVLKIFPLTQINSYYDIESFIHPRIQNKMITLYQKLKVQIFYEHPLPQTYHYF